MEIKQVEAVNGMARGSFVYADSNWFVIDLKLAKDCTDIRILCMHYEDIRSQLNRLNDVLCAEGNPFRMQFSETGEDCLNNKIYIQYDNSYANANSSVVVLDIQSRDSDSAIQYVEYSEDTKSYANAKSFMIHLANHFPRFVEIVSEFVVQTMLI